jgi:hypothetical protein
VLPGRLGVRFALEALFLVLLAIGAGLADLRPAVIVVVMAVAWVLVALIEFTAERIARSPVSYLLPAPSVPEDDPQRIFWPRPEERTVVAPPEQPPAEESTGEVSEPAGPAAEEAPEPEPEPEAESEAVAEVELEPEPEPEAVEELEPEGAEEAGLEPPEPRRRRRLLRRREKEPESTPHAPPRHVKLLPRRAAPEPSRAAREVAELFGPGDDERGKRESGG